MIWSSSSLEEIISNLNTDINIGLTGEEAKKRLVFNGKNELISDERFGLLKNIFKQFKSPLVLILLIAGFVTLFLHEYLDSTVIFIAILINVVIGVFQEGRASKAFEALNSSQERYATVVRDGKKVVLSTTLLVPGDIVELIGGSYVPADIRLTEEKNLSINESALTGEWVAVSKSSDDVVQNEKTKALAEQRNMAWMGTLVSHGFGKGVVVSTGMKTEVGKIAKHLHKHISRNTPLQQSVRKLASFLVYAIGASVIAIVAIGLFRGLPLSEMLLIAIAITVAAAPSGLPAAVTIVLALGMEEILKKGGLVRNLLAAETLGSTTIILTDKTGTLTEARMKLHGLHTLWGIGRSVKEAKKENIDLLQMAVRASDAFTEGVVDKDGKLSIHGRPIEKAIMAAGIDAGLLEGGQGGECPRLDFLQFESSRRFAVSLNNCNGESENTLYFSGAPEVLLAHSTYVYEKGQRRAITDGERKKFLDTQNTLSGDGLRFIGIAMKKVEVKKLPESFDEEKGMTEKLTFVGLLSFIDPIREDVPAAIKTAQMAGAHVMMLTGDNPETARNIAVSVGIAEAGEEVLRGVDIEDLTDKELLSELSRVNIFSRVLPEQKLRIVKVLRSSGEVVAMTGDGVNDAPALRSADIGVAVGSATEVAKEASDLVLLNNSFSILTEAIAEGRRVIDNLKKIIAYLLSTGFSEMIVIGGALAAAAPIPFLPTQILWANIIEEGFMSFAFAFEPRATDVMRRDPRSSKTKQLLTKDMKKIIFIIATITGVFLLILYFLLLRIDIPIEEVRTLMFAALSLDSIFFALSFKDLRLPIWRIPLFSNRYLLISLGVSMFFLVSALTFPPLQKLLSLVPLNFGEILFLVGVGLFNLMIIELVKYLVFRGEKRKL
ncbi:MAG: HAD-IC family P-type ATPase [Parcubacteria group bacterium]|nr:HAD-IC family P-type ATPase [Parcubacteria group bacterium]